MSEELIDELLSRWVQFHPIFAKIGGSATAGIFLSQAYHWSKYTRDPGRWFYKTQKEWEQETTLTRYEQESARKQLRERGILQEKLEGVPAKLYYRLHFGELRSKMTVVAKLNALSMRENHILGCGETTNKIDGLPHTPICTQDTSSIPELKNSGHAPLELFSLSNPVEKEAIPAPQTKRRGRPPKTDKPADPRHKEAIDMWTTLWNQRFSTTYSFHPKDAKHLQTFLAANPSLPVSKMREALEGIWSLEVEKGAFAPNSIRILNLCDLCLRWNTIIGNLEK